MLVVLRQVEQAALGRLEHAQSCCRPTAADNVRAEPGLHPLVCHLEAIRRKSPQVKPKQSSDQRVARPSQTGHGLWEMKSPQTAQAEPRRPSSSLTSPQTLQVCVFSTGEIGARVGGLTHTHKAGLPEKPVFNSPEAQRHLKSNCWHKYLESIGHMKHNGVNRGV